MNHQLATQVATDWLALRAVWAQVAAADQAAALSAFILSESDLMSFNLAQLVAAYEAAGGGGYTGPLDIVPGAVVAWGNIALSAAYRGSALYTLKRSSDDAMLSFNSDATTGDPSSADIIAWRDAEGAATASTTLFNDQSGNSIDLTPSDDPFPWGANVFGGLPGITASSAGGALLKNNHAMPSGAYTVIFVAYYDISAGANTFVVWDPLSSGFFLGGFYNELGDLFLDVGNPETDEATWVTNGTIATGNHIFAVVVDAGGAASISVDGVDLEATLVAGTAQPVLPNSVYVALDGGGFVKWGACLMWNSAVSGPNLAAVTQNMADRFNITLP